jgi:hypothetical protein
MNDIIILIIQYFDITLNDIAFMLWLLFIVTITFYISSFIAYHGTLAILKLLKLFKIISENLRLDSRIIVYKNNYIENLENELASIKKELDNQKLINKLMKEA